MGVTATTSHRSSIQVSGSASAPMSTSQPASVLFHTSHTTPPMDPSFNTPSAVSTESATSVISKPGQESGITLTFPSAGMSSPSSSEPTVDVTQSLVTYSPMPSSTNKGDSAGRNAAIRRNFQMTTLALFSILAMQVVPLFF
ncbi:hypothetical protein C2E23DRAFT_461629 [Lenzites betulinus]|nr:hypothetical protein C2E23DRAFT_461629 [Lenzites betulinus]